MLLSSIALGIFVHCRHPLATNSRDDMPRRIAALIALSVMLTAPHSNIAGDANAACFHDGPAAGSLRSDQPLPIYDDDPQHLWNRLFAALYIRPSHIPDEAGGAAVARIEGGDIIDFLGWAGTTYWDEPDVNAGLNAVVDEFLADDGAARIDDPLYRAILLRDVWAAFDFLTDQNIRRKGSIQIRRQRTELCSKLARIMQGLSLSDSEVEALPDNYQTAIESGEFITSGALNPSGNYLPGGLFSRPQEWVEIDFFQPDLHEDLSARLITLHTRSYRARSYFRVFYRFPGGRTQLTAYLQELNETGIDWKQAAQDGFILLKPDAPQIPVGTELALIQFMMTLNSDLQPVPTSVVESVRMRSYLNVDGAADRESNTGVGMNVMEYTLKRLLLFDDLRHGGLAREGDEIPLYRVIFQGEKDPDWGHDGRKALFQQCVDCHMSPNADRTGVHSLPSIVHMGGFDAGAQLGVAVPLTPEQQHVRGERAAGWKLKHETYRRLLEFLDR